MKWILAVLGLIIGGAFGREEGSLLGLVMGFILGWQISLSRRLRTLEQRFSAVQAEPVKTDTAAQHHLTDRATPSPPASPHRTTAPQSTPPDPDAIAQPDPGTPRNEPTAYAASPLDAEQPRRSGRTSRQQADPLTPPRVMALRVWQYLSSGNPFVRLGMLILFFGLAFLVKYASDQGMLPVELRLTAVAVTGLGLMALGWRLRDRAEGFGLVLQGGGIAALYLTTFGAFHLYHLIPQFPAFAGLVVITVAAVMLAVMQNSRVLAFAGVCGGFLAPVLISTDSGNHVALFSYYALLNGGIFAVAWRKTWRELNLLGFVFTFGVATVWGVLRYRPEQFASTEPFLVLFFLMYLGMAILYALHGGADAGAEALRNSRQLALGRLVDGTLVFGNPLIAFGLQWALVRNLEYGIALSAFALGVIHLAAARLLWLAHKEAMRPMTEAFVALGIIFSSLAIPYTLDNQWSSAAWALEGAGILWVGMRQGQPLTCLLGLLLQAGGGLLFLHNPPDTGDLLFLNGFFFGTLMVATAGLFSAWVVEHPGTWLQNQWLAQQKTLRNTLWLWGLCWWYAGAFWQFDAQLIDPDPIQALVLFAAATSSAFAAGFHRWGWQGAFLPAHLLLGFLLVGLFLLEESGAHPGQGLGAITWPLSWVSFYLTLFYLQRWRPASTYLPLLHIGGALLLLVTLTWELGWHLQQRVDPAIWRHWQPVWLGLLPVIALAVVLRGRFWPLTSATRVYRFQLGGLLAFYCALWGLLTNVVSDASAPPLPFIPRLNPLDLLESASLLLLANWLRTAKAMAAQTPEQLHAGWTLLGGLVFVFATSVLLRALHHWLQIPYLIEDLWDSMQVQMSLALFWGLAGLGLMVAASRLSLRRIWLVGGTLLGLVVAKLMLVDLAAGGTLERVVSFVAVGLLLVLVGFFSPLPPKKDGPD
jgi:uncharacterized membrane protein